MKATAMIHMRLVVAGIAILLLAVSPAELNGQQNTNGTVSIGSNDLGGVVTSTKGYLGARTVELRLRIQF